MFAAWGTALPALRHGHPAAFPGSAASVRFASAVSHGMLSSRARGGVSRVVDDRGSRDGVFQTSREFEYEI